MTAPAVLATRTPTTPSSSAAPSVPSVDRSPQRQPGFLLWVGVDPQDVGHPAAEIIELAEALGELARELLPTAETYTALSLGRASTHGSSSEDLGALRDRLADLEVIAHSPLWQDTPTFDVDLSPRVRIDLGRRQVTADGTVRRLTYKEFELLAYLVTSAGRVVPRTELFTSVWRSNTADSPSRTIDVHVRRLRDKLGLHDQIVTVRGAGYRFVAAGAVDVVAAA